METKLKSGFLSSEFITTIVAQIVSFLVVSGIVDPVESAFWIDSISRVLFAFIGLITTLAYIRGRIELKKQQMQQTVDKATQ